MTDWPSLKRFYEVASFQEQNGAFGIVLDGKPVRTPAGGALEVARKALAEEISAEWAAQGEVIETDTMPLTKLAATAIDRIRLKRADVVGAVTAFAGTDLLCYRADEPPELVARQTERWQPLLDWAADELEAAMTVTTGVLPVPQPAAAIDRLRDIVDGLDTFHLAGVSAAAAAAGSVVVALALAAGRIEAGEAGDVALLDEEFQMERWGQDSEALARHRRIRGDLEAAARFMRLLDRNRSNR